MALSTFGARALVVRLVWLWVLLGLLLLIGSGSMLYTRHRYNNQKAADQLEQVKMQMVIRIEEETVENTEIVDLTGMQKFLESISEAYVSSININDLEGINDNDITYSVKDKSGHKLIVTDTNDSLNVTKESSNYADSNIIEEEHAEYIYDADYEEEIQEEIKSVETHEIKKDSKYSISKKPKYKKYKIKKNNKEHAANSKDSLKEDSSNECNYLPCPVQPPGLLGVLKIPDELNEVHPSVFNGVRSGGSWWPSDCQARFRVAVVVPYIKTEDKQMLSFLQHIHGFLQRQQLNYTLFFIQQHGEKSLNHGQLLNVGYHQAKSVGPWDCWVFHNMNLMPLDDRHLYHCDPFPRHLSVRTQHNPLFPVNELEFYRGSFKGATMLTQEHMEATNGWSNKFWDAEEDLGRNMKYRLQWQDLPIWRYPPVFANYKMVGNLAKPSWVDGLAQQLMMKYLGVKTSDFTNDGLSSLDYKVLNNTQEPLYTNILVDIGTKEDPRQQIKHKAYKKKEFIYSSSTVPSSTHLP